MISFNAAIAIGGGTVLALGLIAGYVKARLWMAEATICLLVGILVGPEIFNFVDLTGLELDRFVLLEEAARLTLAIAVMGAALRLPTCFEIEHWKGLGVALGFGIPLMWLTSAALAGLLLGGSILVALLIGAILSPTDPVVAGSIVNGRMTERILPDRVRNLLSAESGANDGLALLVVMLPILLINHASGAALYEWSTRVLLWEIVGAVAIGAAAGWLAGRLLVWAYHHPDAEQHSTLTIALALTLTVLATMRLIGSDGILAVFVAGLMLNRVHLDREVRQEHIQEAIERFFSLPVFVLLGTVLPWHAWAELGWRGVAFALGVLFLRRLPWWLLLQRAIPETATRRDAAFLGWFGPMGVASIYYAVLSLDHTGLTQIWPVVSLVVFASLIAHGVTATPFVRWFGNSTCRANDAFGEVQN